MADEIVGLSVMHTCWSKQCSQCRAGDLQLVIGRLSSDVLPREVSGLMCRQRDCPYCDLH